MMGAPRGGRQVDVLDEVHVLDVRLHELTAELDTLVRALLSGQSLLVAPADPGSDVRRHQSHYHLDRAVLECLVGVFDCGIDVFASPPMATMTSGKRRSSPPKRRNPHGRR